MNIIFDKSMSVEECVSLRATLRGNTIKISYSKSTNIFKNVLYCFKSQI